MKFVIDKDYEIIHSQNNKNVLRIIQKAMLI